MEEGVLIIDIGLPPFGAMWKGGIMPVIASVISHHRNIVSEVSHRRNVLRFDSGLASRI